MKRYRDTRMEILQKYNITAIDADRWLETFPSTSFGREDFLEWDFSNSFLFAMVVITTIGYGNIVPKTVQGRLFCVVYALFGIPGTCLTLKAVGDKIAEIFTRLVTTFEQRLLKRPHSRHVELKVAFVTIFLTVVLLLPLMSLVVKVRHQEWTYISSFYFTFITLSTIGFGDLLPQFDKDADYILVLLAFVGLAFVSSIFCSMNTVLEQYGVSVRMVRSLRDKRADGEEFIADEGADLDNKDKSTCDSNGLQDGAVIEKETHVLQTNNTENEENGELELKPLSNRNSLIIDEEGKMANRRKRGSSVSLGIFQC
ncbi:Potassium channel subfamily K member 5 [Stylophora pistillata]|uniref:Potassium channel subfamily K member 5 n=2 Tax=Stylophora pistillata TaxID=50429 RepID=A0A2B4S4C0_STYPI|nr:Potassium channel subfamily K member 5 [Stylophora pistillata]